MIARPVTGASAIAGVVGAPISHSLSPLIHNAWLAASGLDGVYVPFAPDPSRFERFVDGLRGGSLKGVNVTLPFKERALRLADTADMAAQSAGAANLLLFRPDGGVDARNTDGVGLLAAFAEQAPRWSPGLGPVVVLGAGGAARGAVAALVGAGASIRVVNRNRRRAEDLIGGFSGVMAFGFDQLRTALDGATTLIGAAPLDEDSCAAVAESLDGLPPSGIVMDMVYAPLDTPLLQAARTRGFGTVDGLAMLIGQARPSFASLFGVPAPSDVDIRGLAERALGARP